MSRARLIDEITLTPPLRDSTPREVWRTSLRATWSTWTASPMNAFGVVLVLVLTTWQLVTTPGFFSLDWTSMILELMVAGLKSCVFLAIAVWGASVLYGLRTVRHQDRRSICSDHAAMTIIEETKAGETLWKFSDHVSYPRGRGHGKHFRAELLTAALPVAYPSEGEPRAIVSFGAWHPKVVALYRATVAPHGFIVVETSRAWYGGKQYRIEPAPDPEWDGGGQR